MHNRTAIMKAAWSQYRSMQGPRQPFNRKLFADVLRFIWSETKRRACNNAEAEARRARAIADFARLPVVPLAPLSELEQRIDALKYLSFRHNIAAMERSIRAEYQSCLA